jgi:hypothetical protein
MRAVHGYCLEVVSTKGHHFEMIYADESKGRTAAAGFLRAMREAPPESVATLWENGVVLTEDGVSEERTPVFMIRAGEVGSVSLKTYCSGHDEEEV